jgi:predicted enzyme related to lactoylglutathione lyase
MSIIDKSTPGDFCWVELGTTDAKAAKAFYGALFGWAADDMPIGPDSFYTMLRLRGEQRRPGRRAGREGRRHGAQACL